MTPEKLVRIVAETVQRMMALWGLSVGVCVFDAANKEKVCSYARSLNGKYRLLDIQQNTDNERRAFDVLFTDKLPAGYLARLALGISDDTPTQYINETVLQGGTIFVLDDGPPFWEKTPASYAALLAEYRSILRSYGYVFLDTGKYPGGTSATEQKYIEMRDRKVITQADIILLENGSSLSTNGAAVITDLAKDTALRKNITITRKQGGTQK